jgi:hypothetical protein
MLLTPPSVRAEAPTDRGAVFRNPVTAELEKVIHIARVNLRPNEQMLCYIKPHTGRHMKLEMVRAIQKRAAR